jgi:PAS domain S-box-containing protein
LHAALIVVAYICAFIILDIITKQLVELPGIVTWYPPAGLTYAVLLVFGMRFGPAVTIALLISSLFIYRMPQPPYLLFLWAFTISLIYSLAAAFLRHRIRFDWRLRKLRDVAWFVITTVLVSALLAVLSVSSSALSSAMPRSEIFRSIFHWWIGETVGVLTVTPFLLIYVMPSLKRFAEGQPVKLLAIRSFPRPTLSTIVQASSIALTLYWVFGAPILDEFHPLYLITLPLVWIALQRGFKGISVALLAVNSGVVLALWLFRFDLGRLGELELLMVVNCIVGLLMGAIVTERKQVEQILQKSEEHLQLVTDNMQDLVVRTDLQGLILYASPSNKTVLGYEPEYLLGKSIYDFMHPEDIQRVMEFTLASLQTKTPGKQELRYRHVDGHSLWLESTGAIIFDEDGTPVGAVFSSRDITERKRADVALRESQQSQATLISNLPGFVYRCANDRNWTTMFMSEGCRDITGFAPEDFLQNKKLAYNDIIHQDHRERLWLKWQTCLEDKIAFEDEYPIITAQGKTRWLWERGRGIFSEDGRLLFLEGFITDITERELAGEA